MRTVVLRARAAPTDSQRLLAAVGQDAHTEILAHTLMNAIFVAQSHRPGVVVYLVLESTQPQLNGECRDINYDPLVLPAGIEGSDDPLLAARSAGYATSYLRRTSEVRQLPAANKQESRQ